LISFFQVAEQDKSILLKKPYQSRKNRFTPAVHRHYSLTPGIAGQIRPHLFIILPNPGNKETPPPDKNIIKKAEVTVSHGIKIMILSDLLVVSENERDNPNVR
jgi:hypothetical protein